MAIAMRTHKEEEEGSYKLADDGSEVGLGGQGEAVAQFVRGAALIGRVNSALTLPRGARRHREGTVEEETSLDCLRLKKGFRHKKTSLKLGVRQKKDQRTNTIREKVRGQIRAG